MNGCDCMNSTSPGINPEVRPLRVAAYVQVKSLDDSSMYVELLKHDYCHKINSHPNWQYTGVYIDERIHGSAASRQQSDDNAAPAFQHLMDDAMAGKIDLIWAKSMSRFGLDFEDCLLRVYELMRRDIGVFFEYEGYDTLNPGREFTLKTIAALTHVELDRKGF